MSMLMDPTGSKSWKVDHTLLEWQHHKHLSKSTRFASSQRCKVAGGFPGLETSTPAPYTYDWQRMFGRLDSKDATSGWTLHDASSVHGLDIGPFWHGWTLRPTLAVSFWCTAPSKDANGGGPLAPVLLSCGSCNTSVLCCCVVANRNSRPSTVMKACDNR